jgi:hypothetical protein
MHLVRGPRSIREEKHFASTPELRSAKTCAATNQGQTMDNQKPPPSEQDISALARRFWEEEGQPEGQAEEHWLRAEEELRKWHGVRPPEGEAGLPPVA